jgi:hypothetical protein
MKYQCKPSLFNLLLALIIVLILIYALSGIGCTKIAYLLRYEDSVLDDVNFDRPQSINEKVWPVFNKEHLSVGDFLIEAGKNINAKAEYHGWQINRVRIEGNRNLVRKYEIHTIWFYYD